ncbi:MAG: site-specific integrase [Xanthomonadaceae bacterium]|nr:site-specific integrase [Xanthomonadaceae bacterium]
MAITTKHNAKGVRYTVRVRDPLGAWYQAQTFDRKIDAEKRELELIQRRMTGSNSMPLELRQMPLSTYWEKWKVECRTRVSMGWKQSQDTTARKYILPYLGEKRLTEIRSPDIGVLLHTLERKGLSEQSSLHVYNLLHKMFEDAVEFYELIELNPVRKRFRPKVFRTEREFLNPNEAWKLLEVARTHPKGAAVWISILSGLRPGEVQALRWSSIDFDRNQILIRATYNKKTRTVQDHPKQKDWGRAPMPNPLVEFLREKSHGKKLDEFVVQGQTGNMLIYDKFVTHELPRLCRLAGVKRVTPHELRHTCTELYVQAGASAEDLRRLLNHKSLSATLRYIHRTDEQLQSIAEKVLQKPKPTPDPVPLRLVKMKLV